MPWSKMRLHMIGDEPTHFGAPPFCLSRESHARKLEKRRDPSQHRWWKKLRQANRLADQDPNEVLLIRIPGVLRWSQTHFLLGGIGFGTRFGIRFGIRCPGHEFQLAQIFQKCSNLQAQLNPLSDKKIRKYEEPIIWRSRGRSSPHCPYEEPANPAQRSVRTSLCD